MKTLFFARESGKTSKKAINASIFVSFFAKCQKNMGTYIGVSFLKVQTMKSPNPGKRKPTKKSTSPKKTESQIVRKDSAMTKSLRMLFEVLPGSKNVKAR